LASSSADLFEMDIDNKVLAAEVVERSLWIIDLEVELATPRW